MVFFFRYSNHAWTQKCFVFYFVHAYFIINVRVYFFRQYSCIRNIFVRARNFIRRVLALGPQTYNKKNNLNMRACFFASSPRCLLLSCLLLFARIHAKMEMSIFCLRRKCFFSPRAKTTDMKFVFCGVSIYVYMCGDRGSCDVCECAPRAYSTFFSCAVAVAARICYNWNMIDLWYILIIHEYIWSELLYVYKIIFILRGRECEYIISESVFFLSI